MTSGRTKKKGFRGTPSKLENPQCTVSKNCTVGKNTGCQSSNTNPTVLSLRNNGKNVCFFNAIIQLLYALPEFKQFVV